MIFELIAAAIIGALAYSFREDLLDWLNSTAAALLNSVNTAIESAFKFVVTLTRTSGRLYRSLKLLVRIKTGNQDLKIYHSSDSIPIEKVPDEIKELPFDEEIIVHVQDLE
jgi:hypothetical protein